MANTSIELDASGMLDEDFGNEMRSKLAQAMHELAQMTFTHILEQAELQLNTRSGLYSQSLKSPKKINDFQYEIALDSKADWIEKGIPKGFDMLPGLLKSPKAKNGKNGKYIIIPFDHLKSKQTPQQKHLKQAIFDHFKGQTPAPGKHNIKAHGLITKKDGALKAKLMESPEGRPFLQSTMVYNKGGGKQDIKTFRTATEKHKGVKWIHPGIKPFDGLEQGAKWAEQNLETILKNLSQGL